MLPPVLEIYVVWHPSDRKGRQIAQEIVSHFHGTPFTGLMGGAVEVFIRSEGWATSAGAPRPILLPDIAPPNGVVPAQFTAVMPILGNEMAAAVQPGSGDWFDYLQAISRSQSANPTRVCILPYRMDPGVTNGTVLGSIFGSYQAIAAAAPDEPSDTYEAMRCRDLAQSIMQFLSSTPRLTAFISHTKRSSSTDSGDVRALIELVRNVIAATHLQEFFDAADLQPGENWDAELRDKAGHSALLALRTDLYPSREWCQKEFLIAKRCGMPVITLDALGESEERGSFLMDHVPRVPVRVVDGTWVKRDVYRALNILVDECLKRALWQRQHELARDRDDLLVSWWAPHAPEPVTLAQWLEEAKTAQKLSSGNGLLRILHPDPPLGPDERAVLEQILSFGGLGGRLDVMTPRQLAARGG